MIYDQLYVISKQVVNYYYLIPNYNIKKIKKYFLVSTHTTNYLL